MRPTAHLPAGAAGGTGFVGSDGAYGADGATGADGTCTVGEPPRAGQ